MTKQQIAENYINGNHSDVKRELKGSSDHLASIGRAFDVYQYLRGQYGQKEATRFSNWLQGYSDFFN